MAVDKWSPETPWFGPDKKTAAHWPTYVCRNPSCKSVGKSHPNCKCGIPSFAAQSRSLEYSAGGEVHFCSHGIPHENGCEYFDAGGSVDNTAMPALLQNDSQDEPLSTVGHVSVEHGLSGLLGGQVGHASLNDPIRSGTLLWDAKRNHDFKQRGPSHDGLQEHGPQTSIGTKWADHMFHGEHDKSADVLHGNPLVGGVSKATLEPILKKLSGPMLERETDPEAFRGAVDYLASSARGSKRMDEEMKNLMGPHHVATHMQEMSRESAREELKEKLKDIQANPRQLLESTGNLGHYLPNHAGALAFTNATAVKYLNSIKPMSHQAHPLEEPTKPNPLDMDNYERQLDLANHPLLALNHIKDGTLTPQDLTTLQTIYPGLHKTMIAKAGEQLIEHKNSGMEVPYPHKMALSLMLGQPLDGTMTSEAMMAIINSASNATPQTGTKQPTAQTQKTIDKTTSLYATPDEQREMNHKA